MAMKGTDSDETTTHGGGLVARTFVNGMRRTGAVSGGDRTVRHADGTDTVCRLSLIHI